MRRSRWPAICIMTLLALLLVLTGCPNDPDGGDTAVATPTFSPEGGEYFGVLTVYLSCTTSGAEIYYTTNGVDPTQSDGLLYTSAGVTIDASCTLKARAFKDGMPDSYVGSMVYTILAVPSQVPTPVLEGSASGVYLPSTYSVQVYPTCTLGPVVFVYTTDGTDPVPNATDPADTPVNGTVWTGGYVTVTRRTMVKVIAVYIGTAPGVADSEIARGFYDVFGNTVNAGNTSSPHNALCVDSAGKHHLVYWSDTPPAENDKLMYATDTGGTWQSELIYSTTYDVQWQWMAIGVTSTGDVHVAAMRNAGGGLRHFVRSHTDGTWSGPYTVDSTEGTNYVGPNVTMVVDSTNLVRVVYYDATAKDVKHAYFDGAAWHAYSLESGGDIGEFCSVALDAGNYMRASWYDATNADLVYRTSVDDSMTTVDSAGDVGKWSSIAVDGNDKVHISYFDATNRDLKYATNASGSWVTETVDSTGSMGLFTSIAVDADGIPCITYYSGEDAGPYNLRYAVKPFDTWLTKEILFGATKYAHVAVDSGGYAGIVYPGKFLKDGP